MAEKSENIQLIERKKIFEYIQENLKCELLENHDKYLNYLKKCVYNINIDQTASLENFVSWVSKNKNLKMIGTNIPNKIISNAILYDIKVQSRGPDDLVYDQNSDIRALIARGNCILERKINGKNQSELILYALRKFTGGLGDEDELDRNKNDWKNYFLKNIEETNYVISLEKANGESAHMSCRWVDDDFLICAGSKNVHLLFRKAEEISEYSEERFKYAKIIAEAISKHLDSMTNELRAMFLSFLCWTKLTIIFEILIPTSQHVVDLSYLKEPLLKFITFTECKLYDKPTSLCCMPPELSLEIGKVFKFSCVDWKKLSYSDVESHLHNVRKGHGYEGVVLYFLDSDLNVIGLLKKKTTWYIILRAIREKIRGFISTKNTLELSELEKRVYGRLVSIKSWISFSDDDLLKWKVLSSKFINWFANEYQSNKVSKIDFNERFPVLWNAFLTVNNLNDSIDIKISSNGEEI